MSLPMERPCRSEERPCRPEEHPCRPEEHPCRPEQRPLRAGTRLCATLPPPLPPLLVLLVIVLVPAVSSEQWYRAGASVCLFSPADSPAPTAVRCHLAGHSITIKRVDLAASVREVYVSDANIIDVDDSALSHLENLTVVRFASSERLLLREHSVSGAAAAADGATSVTIDGVRDVTLFADAFSGWRRPGLSVTVRGARSCALAAGAFPAGAHASHVLLSGVSDLSLERHSFAADIARLELRNVTSEYACLADTFSGGIGHLTLHDVTLQRIASGCLRAGRPWDSLHVRHSRLGAVPPRAFVGEIGEVNVQDSELGEVSPAGFALNVSRFTLERCHVSALSAGALHVLADETIAASNCTIGLLEGDALLELRAPNTSVRHLSVTTADDGALRLHDAQATALGPVLLDERCECATAAERAARLVIPAGSRGNFSADSRGNSSNSSAEPGGHWPSAANLSDSEQAAVQQAAMAVRCRRGSERPTPLAELACGSCGGGGGGLVLCPAALPGAGRGWMLWPLLLLAALLLLLMAGCGPLLMVRRWRPPGSMRRHKPAGGAGVQEAPARNASDITPPPPAGAGHGLSWRVVAELEPEQSDHKPSAERSRHLSWRVVSELEPEPEPEPEPRRIAGSGGGAPDHSPVSGRPVFESVTSIPEPEPEHRLKPAHS